MRPTFVLYAMQLGIPGWLVPNYFILVGLSSLLAFLVVMRLTARDKADAYWQSRGLIWVYLGALAGGYIVESLRMVPAAIMTGSLAPILSAGRSAYGGLLTALLCASIYIRINGQSVAAFLDRTAVGGGIVFCFVRTGCFLAGCDYGVPTSSRFGVRFPSGSLAAIDHAQRGFVPMGFPSLPVHPTQLYEAAVGLSGSLVAWLVLRSSEKRDGAAILSFFSIYACGRFCIELLRGDEARGVYFGLSTAQYISLAMLSGCALGWRGLRHDEKKTARPVCERAAA
jgi:phosphatidylglycerol:prolipoprotein diacylglycerol transferase